MIALHFTHKAHHRALSHGSCQGSVRSQWLFHWQVPQRRHNPCARAPFGQAARQSSAALCFIAMEQPFLQKRALHIITGRLAEARFVGKVQC